MSDDAHASGGPPADTQPGAFGRIGFDRVLDGPDQARAAMVDLTKAARGA